MGVVGGLKSPALRRDRTGVVLKCTREHPSRVRKGAFLYNRSLQHDRDLVHERDLGHKT